MTIAEYKRMLSRMISAIRMEKPLKQVSRETKIAECQLEKYKAECHPTYRPRIDEHVRLIRSIQEASPEYGQELAQAGVPDELYRVVPLNVRPATLVEEMVDLMAAVGSVSTIFKKVMADGKLTSDEKEELRQALTSLDRNSAEYRASLDSHNDESLKNEQ